MRFLIRLISFLLGLSLAGNLTAAEVQEAPLSRPNILSFHMDSQVLNQTMIIEIGLPASYAYTDESYTYPVTYVADGVTTFLSSVADQYRSSFGSYMPEMITVGIEFHNYLDACYRDQWYTPTQIADDENCGQVGGGADQFLTFVRDELKPFINSILKVDEASEVFAGHSHTGSLALYTLFTQPDLFDMYVASSPALYWDNEVMFQYEQQFADAQSDLDKPVFISVGLNETGGLFGDQATTDYANQTVFSYVFRMARKLKHDFPSSPIHFQAFPGETHGAVVGPAFHQGIHFVMTEGAE